MQGRASRWIGGSALVLLLAACGTEQTRYDDKKIVERLNLEKTDAGFAIDGDPFCEVKRKLLNNADEIQRAADRDELGLVIASGEGNAGIEGVPPFAPDCKQQAKKKLNKLDPVPKEE